MVFIRVLVVEDTDKDSADLEAEFKQQAKKLGFIARVDCVKTRNAARNAFASRHYHIISLDQSIPVDFGSATHATDYGFELAKEFSRSKRCFLGSVYTNVPENDKMHATLKGTEFHYREKAIKTDERNNSYTARDFVKLNLSEFVSEYHAKAFEQLKTSGFKELVEGAGICRNALLELEERQSDETSTLFYRSLFPFSEQVIFRIAAILWELSNSLGVEVAELPTYHGKRGPKAPTQETLLNWISASCIKLSREAKHFTALESFFIQGSPFGNIGEYFVEACKALKNDRNTEFHASYSATLEDHIERRPYLTRFLDFCQLLSNMNMLYQASKLRRSNVLSAKDLNTPFPKTEQIDFEDTDFKVIDASNIQQKEIIFRLPGIGFVPVTFERFRVGYSKQNVPSVLYVPWFEE